MSVSLAVPDLDEELMRRLQGRASQHGRSAEAEVRHILRQVLITDAEPDSTDLRQRGFEERAAELRALLAGRNFTPSEILLRESRDER